MKSKSHAPPNLLFLKNKLFLWPKNSLPPTVIKKKKTLKPNEHPRPHKNLQPLEKPWP